MPTTYNDQFYIIDPYAPPPVGTTMVQQRFDMVDNNDDGDIDRFNFDNVNGIDITASYAGDTVTVFLTNVGNVTYTGITFYLANGTSVFTPTDGQILQTGTLVSTTYVTAQNPLLVGDIGPPCLTPGVLVDSVRGRVPVEELRAGDMLHTLDHGPQPALWIGRTILRADPEHAPVRFGAGAVGNTEAFSVSPQHRIFVGGWQAELHFGQPEVFVSAVHLLGLPGVTRSEACRVTYLHILLARHEIIRTAGAWSESYFPGTSLERHEDEIRKALPKDFAHLASLMRAASLARPQVTGREAKVLAA